MGLITSNLVPRLRLLRTALTRRFIYNDIVTMAQEYGLSIRDVYADVEPFELAALASGSAPIGPDYSVLHEKDFPALEDYTSHWSSEPSVARFLGRLTATRRPAIVIELGCFVGWSTVHIALALAKHAPHGRVHFLDYHARYLSATTSNLRRLGLETFGVAHQGMSTDPAVQQALPAQADIVFIDTSHTYEDTLREIDHYGSRLSPGGCLVLHDTLSASDVHRAVNERQNAYRVATFATERSNGISVLWPK